MTLACEMPVATIAQFVDATDTPLWRVIDHYVAKAMQTIYLSGLEAFGLMDLDRDTRTVVFATEGKGKEVVYQFKQHLQSKNGATEQVFEVVRGMSGSFVSAVKEQFKSAEVTVD